MAFTYDLGTAEGKVRLIVADSRDEGHIFEDDEVTAFLEMNASSVRLAAADALDTIASNESLVQKAITLLDLKTDGPKTAADLRKHAATLRSLAADEVALASADPGFDIADNPAGFWAERKYAWNEAARA